MDVDKFHFYATTTRTDPSITTFVFLCPVISHITNNNRNATQCAHVFVTLWSPLTQTSQTVVASPSCTRLSLEARLTPQYMEFCYPQSSSPPPGGPSFLAVFSGQPQMPVPSTLASDPVTALLLADVPKSGPPFHKRAQWLGPGPTPITFLI